MREQIVMPLITIQQYAIAKCREMNERGQKSPHKAAYEKLIIRSRLGLLMLRGIRRKR
jgi:phosphoenolpyruvate carboxylase